MIKTVILYLFFFTLPSLCIDRCVLLKNNNSLFCIPLHVAQTSEVLTKKITSLPYPYTHTTQHQHWKDAHQPWDITELALSNEEIEYFTIALNICWHYTSKNQKTPHSCKDTSLFPIKTSLIAKKKLKKLATLSKNFSSQSFFNIYRLCTYFITPALQYIIEKKMHSDVIKNPECYLQWPFVFNSEKNIIHHTLQQAHRSNLFFLLPYTTIEKTTELPLQKIAGNYCSVSQDDTTTTFYILCDSQGNRYQFDSATGEQTPIYTTALAQNLCHHQKSNDTVLTVETNGTLKVTHNTQPIIENVQVISAALQQQGNYSYETIEHELVIFQKNRATYTNTLIPYHNLFYKGTSTHHTLSTDGCTVCIIQKYFYHEPNFIPGVGEVLLHYNAPQKQLKKIHINKQYKPTQALLINDQGSVALMFRQEFNGNENYIHYLDLITEKEICIPLPQCTEPILAASYNKHTLQLILLHEASLSFWNISRYNLQSKDLTFLMLCDKDPLFYQKYSHVPWVHQTYTNLQRHIQEEITAPTKSWYCSLL